MWTYFIHNYKLAYVIIIGIALMGVNSFLNLPRESEPDIDIPIGVITTVYPGANPLDIENLITSRIESKIANVENIEDIESVSGFGVSNITVEFDAKADLDESISDLKDAVDLAKAELPSDSDDPIVSDVKISDASIITFSLTGSYTQEQLKNFAEILQEELEKISDVSYVTIFGGQNREINITLHEAEIENYGISIPQVVNLIRSSHQNLPLGSIEKSGFKYELRFEGELQTVEDFKKIPIFTQLSDNGNISTLFLEDIADIENKEQDKETISKIGSQGKFSQESVSLQVYKKSGGDVFDIVEKTKEIISKKTSFDIPEDLQVTITGDNTVFIKRDFDRLWSNFFQTIIAIAVILYFGLNLREGLIAAFSVVLIFLLTFIVFDVLDKTLNGMIIFALMISMGLIVDTAVVIIEGMHEELKKGHTAHESALISLNLYKWPLISGIFTAIAAFLPMFLVSGIVGEYLSNIPLTLTVCLVASLFVSLFLVPPVAVRLLKKEEKTIKDEVGKLGQIYDKFIAKYIKVLTNILSSKARSNTLLGVFVVLFFLSLSLPILGILKVEMFPKIDVDFFNIEIETAEGSSLEQTEKVVSEIEKFIVDLPELENYISNIGTNESIRISEGFENTNASSNLALITVNLKEAKLRQRSSLEIGEDLTQKLQILSDQAIIKVSQLNPGPPSAYPIEIRMQGDDLEVLKTISNDVLYFLKNIEGTKDIESDFDNNSSEFVLSIDREKAALFGFSAQDISTLLRTAVYGVNIFELKDGKDDIDVKLKLDFDKHDTSIDEVLNLTLINNKGDKVAIGNFVDIELKEAFKSVKRFNQIKIARIHSDVMPNTNAFEISEKLKVFIEGYKLEDGYTMEIGGEREDIAKSFNELFSIMFLGVVLIVVILLAQFNSFLIPVIIMLTIPLGLIGVFPGLVLVGKPLSFLAFLGIVALAGIVVDNAIVLIDKINRNLVSMSMKEAVIDGCHSRIKPIFLTSIDTIIGSLPSALNDQFWSGFGWAVIWGFSFSTVLTLIVIPVAYNKFVKVKPLIDVV